MGILRRIADKFDPERRAAGDPFFTPPPGLSGTRAINPHLAENLSTVLACVGAISGAISSLPVWIYRSTDKGRELVEDHPIMHLVRNGPNRHQTWPDFVEWWIASTLLRGNGLAEVRRDNAGRVTELVPVPWEHASVVLLPSGRLAYDVTNINTMYGGTGRMRRLLDGEATHLRDRSDDGLLGRSRLQRAASVVSAGLAVQEHAAAMFENQATPSGAIEVDAKISPEQRKQIAEDMARFSGSSNARKVMVLDQGMEFKPISLSAEDAELLASRRFSTEELARLYQVPPPIIGDLSHGTFTNSETAGRWFAQHTLTPWIRKIETEMGRSLLSEAARVNHEIEIDLTGFLRGDPETRWKSHEIAVKNNILDVNEVREMEGFNPKAGTA